MIDVVAGKDRVRAWPRPRGKPKTAKAKKLQDDFRLANEACKYWDPRNIIAIDELRKGTPVLIRDLQIMMMYNRFAHFALSDGRIIYSVQARQDVSDSLDSISPLPGSVLIRTPDGWRFIPPPTEPGTALIAQPDGLAAWEPLPPGGEWGAITGTIGDQTDLQAEFSAVYTAMTAALSGKLNTGLALLIANNLSDIASAATARGNLGLGSAATHALTEFLLKTDNLSGLASISDARDNLSVYSKAYIDALMAGGGGGGAKPCLGSPEGMIGGAVTLGTNNYLMKLVIADHDFTISKIAYSAPTAAATVKLQPFVYSSNAGASATVALLGTGAVKTGSVAGYNEVPLTLPITITKGAMVWLGVSITTASLPMFTQAGGVLANCSNGGTITPANPSPALTTSATYNTIYAFWGV